MGSRVCNPIDKYITNQVISEFKSSLFTVSS